MASAAGSGVASFAVGKDGSLWAWGRSQRGQLGLGSKTVDSPTPQRVTALENETVVEVRRNLCLRVGLESVAMLSGYYPLQNL